MDSSNRGENRRSVVNLTPRTRKIAAMVFAIAAVAAIFLFYFHIAIGVTLWQRFHWGSAALVFHRNAEFALEIGNYYFNVGGTGEYDLKKADYFFSRAIAIDPAVPDAWHQRARISFLKGDFKDALQKINTQISLHGDSFMASYYIRGLIYGYDGQFDKAIPDFEKFLAWDKTNWAARNDLAWIYFQKGDFKSANKLAEEGLQFNPNNTWLLTMKGVTLLNLGKRQEARQVLENALKRAQALTPADWERAYPGNDPKSARDGLEKMVNAIEYNLYLTN